MNCLQNSFEQNVFITPTEVIEHLFCPRFTYFMNVLKIPQHEEQRYKVMKGREIHEEKAKINKEYLRKKIGCVDKEILVYLNSAKYKLKGEIDEVLYLSDGTLAPLDYKFAEYNDRIYKTHKIQSVLYALLIIDNYQKDVKKGYICYTRSNNKLCEIEFKEKDFKDAICIIDEILDIIQKGWYPKKTKNLTKCIDCCYRNICV